MGIAKVKVDASIRLDYVTTQSGDHSMFIDPVCQAAQGAWEGVWQGGAVPPLYHYSVLLEPSFSTFIPLPT